MMKYRLLALPLALLLACSAERPVTSTSRASKGRWPRPLPRPPRPGWPATPWWCRPTRKLRKVGTLILQRGGNAYDAAVAVQFALAVVLPAAGNIGGGGFLVYRDRNGSAGTLDFRETAPAGATPRHVPRRAGQRGARPEHGRPAGRGHARHRGRHGHAAQAAGQALVALAGAARRGPGHPGLCPHRQRSRRPQPHPGRFPASTTPAARPPTCAPAAATGRPATPCACPSWPARSPASATRAAPASTRAKPPACCWPR